MKKINSKLSLKKINITNLQEEHLKNIRGGNGAIGIIGEGLSDNLCQATFNRPAACLPPPPPQQTQVGCCTYVNCPE